MIKTFRGKIVDGGQERIRLSTPKGKVGYKIIKFQLFPNLPGTASSESTCSIYKVEQTSVSTSTATVDFSDPNLLAVSFFAINAGAPSNPMNQTTIVDKDLFNQDIYISHTNTDGTEACNYYFELEVISLSEQGAEYTTIKNIRANS